VNILVAYAGLPASAEIAQQIADRLRKAGLAAAARPVDQVDGIDAYQAVVVGSSVRDQAWLPEASAFLSRFASRLAKVPVWLFSAYAISDVGQNLRPGLIRARPPEGAALTEGQTAIHFRGHRSFAGARGRGGTFFDLLLRVCGGSLNSPREFRDINDWAARIARELHVIDYAKERRRLHLSVRGRP
jgi:menaquinone-dependent protoporphyrinogen oxidase